VTLLLAIAVAGLALPTVRHLRETPPPPAAAVRLSFSAPPGAEPGSGDEALDAAISPDETEIVFVATSGGMSRLWRRSLAADRSEPMDGTEGAQLPAWKQSGGVVSFFAGGRLKQISLPRGGVRELADAASPAGATWLADGSLLFASGGRGPIRRLLNGRMSDATALAAGDVAHAFPGAAGSSGRFVYIATRDDGRRAVRLVADGQERELTTTAAHAMMVEEHLLYVRDGVLLAHRLDPESNTLAGRGIPVASDVGVTSSGRGLFTASRRLLVYATSAPRARELAWFDFAGRRTGATGDPGDYWQVRLSPDDRSAAVTMLDPLLRTLDIAVIPTSAAGDVERLTLALAADTDPVWSPDGARVLFRSMQDGQPNLFTRRVHVRGAPDEPLLRSDLDETPTDWLDLVRGASGSQVLFHARVGTGADILTLDADTGARDVVAGTGFNETDGRWSRDGRWLAYVSDESGRPDIYAMRRTGGGRVRVSFAGGVRPRWSRDGSAVFFLRGSQVMRADLPASAQAAAAPRFATARPVFDVPGIRDFDVAHDSDRLVVLAPAHADTAPRVSALLDWTSEVVRPSEER
jgi:eukaryotic-like serine/threonine-protein kinase